MDSFVCHLLSFLFTLFNKKIIKAFCFPIFYYSSCTIIVSWKLPLSLFLLHHTNIVRMFFVFYCTFGLFCSPRFSFLLLIDLFLRKEVHYDILFLQEGCWNFGTRCRENHIKKIFYPVFVLARISSCWHFQYYRFFSAPVKRFRFFNRKFLVKWWI